MTKEDLKKQLGDLIWRMATDLVHGGKVSPVQFMDYTLGALFYRFISENVTDYCNAMLKEAGAEGDYQDMDDAMAEVAREQIIQAKGFYIAPSQLFQNVVSRAIADTEHKNELNTTLANNFRDIEASAIGTASAEDVEGLFSNFDTNSNGLGATVGARNELLIKLLQSVSKLDFEPYKKEGLDVFGICYEHLIKMYALNSGTKGGEFYTPAEVSYLVAKLAAAGRESVNKVYDPACGSGSLLLNFNKVLGADNVRDGFFGQEINVKTYNLCRMNMFLHNVNYDKFSIKNDDTLLRPQHTVEEPFDAIVSNPPYSTPWEGSDNPTLINDPRYAPAGVLAPKSKSDLAFTMHMLAWLSAQGTAAIVEFPGVLYRGGAEQKIRKYLVANNFVDTVIQLPPNLFFGATIATCIIVLKKNKADERVCFIDASELYAHEGNKNKLADEHIERIYQAHMRKTDEAHFCHVVTRQDIEAEDYNLSVSTYVEQEDKREAVDIADLNARIAQIVEREAALRAEIDQIVSELEGGAA